MSDLPGRFAKGLALALLAVAAACRAGTAQGPADEVQAVRGVLLEAARRFSAHDGAAYLALHAADAELVNVGGQRWRLPQDRDLVLAVFGGVLRDARMELVGVDVAFPRPDVAIARCDMVVGPFTLADGSGRPAERQLATSVLTKEQGRWVVRAFHNTRVAEAGRGG
jgi:uncharacterized protein (TIGR02246 family)